MKNVEKSLTFLVKRVDIRQHVCYTKDMVEGQPSNKLTIRRQKKVGIKMFKSTFQFFRIKITVKLEIVNKRKIKN